jgi:hypothetical protein
MKITRFISLGAAVALVAVAALGPSAAVAKAKKPVVVGTDPTGDWGSNADPTVGPAGAPLGQDLVEAAIGMADAKTVNFIITVTNLPPNGGVPEGTRYTWNMAVDAEQIELDGKWSNYTRGACDPTSGNCPPPRDPGMQPFLIRTECASNGAAVACQEAGIVTATFDPATGTITVPVPVAMIGAKPGSKISGATQSDSGFSGLSAVPSAFYSLSNLPYDTLVVTKVFTVPRK